MRCLRILFGIWYKLDHITNEEVRKRGSQPIGQTPDKINSQEGAESEIYGHVTRLDGLSRNRAGEKETRTTTKEMGRQHC